MLREPLQRVPAHAPSGHVERARGERTKTGTCQHNADADYHDFPDAVVSWSLNLWNIWWTRYAGPGAVDAARRARLEELVRFARSHSPLYADVYRSVPERIDDTTPLPVMTKAKLMGRFDDWVTDRSIRRHDIERFLSDPTRIGERLLGRYLVWHSSGTTGEPGIYVQDGHALAVYDALVATQLLSPRLADRYAGALALKGGRSALITATGEHFASTVSWERLCRASPAFAGRRFSITAPLEQLVDELNAFAPAFIASYPTMLSLLANERAAGRLRVDPSIAWSAGECLSPRTRAKLEHQLGCPVIEEYGASECMSIAFGCDHDWLHVNADWVVLEPVDRNYRPVPAGERSHTVLVTNLANRVQPLIRYDLGDAVIEKVAPCECGNPLPAMRVEGRRDDIVVMKAVDGRDVHLVPQALVTIVEATSSVHRFQVAARSGNEIALRFALDDPQRRRAAFDAVSVALREYLATQHIAGASIVLDEQPPLSDVRSGKLRQVVAEKRSR